MKTSQRLATTIVLGFLTAITLARAADPPSTADLSNQIQGLSNQVQTLTKGMSNADAIFSPYFHAEIGTTVLRPFSISPINASSYQLKLGSTDIRGMVQVVLENRVAWRDATNTANTNAFNSYLKYAGLDFEARLGFAFGGGGSQSSTTVGSGDFFGEGSLGLPLYVSFGEHDPASLPMVQSVNFPEVFGTFASDSQYSEIHGAYGIGASYVTAIPLNAAGLQKDPLQFMVRVGVAVVDSPSIVSANATGPIIGSRGSLPSFIPMGALDITGELRWPLDIGNNQFGYLSLGGTAFRYFDGAEPDQWSLYASVSFSLSRLVGAIIPSK